MNIISWNIQAAKGVDEVTSVDRIADVIKGMADADVICLQEVLCNKNGDQVAEFCTQFPAHTPYFGSAVDRKDGTGRLKFGNLILARVPVLQAVYHKLPQPAEPEVKHMPRQAIELMLDDANNKSCLRLTTTHLDYFAHKQRSAQVNYLVGHYEESCNRAENPSPTGGEQQFQATPESNRCIYIGDFNFTVDSTDYRSMTETAGLIDCWRKVHSEKPHEPTCGIFDRAQWQEGSHCRDYCFASPNVAENVCGITVNVETAASDHQPFLVSLA